MGNLITESAMILRIWEQLLSTQLQSDDENNSVIEKSAQNLNNDDGGDNPLLSRDKVSKAASYNGLPAQFFTARRDKLHAVRKAEIRHKSVVQKTRYRAD